MEFTMLSIQRSRRHNGRYTLMASLLAALLLAGCNEKSGETPATQVAARVNGKEISLHEVNHLLSKAGNVPAEKIDLARKSVLDRLIEQELFAAKAVEDRLDRSPETLMALELARREVMARAYLEHLMATREKLDSHEVTKYYMTHPELFSERKLYNLQELSFPVGSGNPDAIQELVAQGKTLEQIADYLASQNIEARKNGAIRAAEQLPMEFLKVLYKAKDGETLFISDAKDHNVIRVVATRTMPVNEQKATPVIQQFLLNKHVAELKEKQLKALREQAKVEYVGVFADLAKQTPALASTAPTTPSAAR